MNRSTSSRRCAFDGRLESDPKAPDGGWAWTTVGGKEVCSERCRVREQARQAEWAPDSTMGNSQCTQEEPS